jgi:hypothetical protein
VRLGVVGLAVVADQPEAERPPLDGVARRNRLRIDASMVSACGMPSVKAYGFCPSSKSTRAVVGWMTVAV